MRSVAVAVVFIMVMGGLGITGPVAGSSVPLAEDGSASSAGGNVTNPSASFVPVTPMKKLTVIGHDQEGFADDYAYLCEVPASNFYYKGSMVGNPILFWEPEYQGDDSQLILNGVQSDKYLIEDLVLYSNGTLDQIDYVNAPDEAKQWVSGVANSSDVRYIDSSNIYKLSAMIAEKNWAYSNYAVVVPVDMKTSFASEKKEGNLSGTVSGQMESGQFTGEIAPSPTDPQEHEFTIGEGYTFIEADLTWGNTNSPLSQLTERGKDPDLQLYDEKLGQVGASEEWNVLTGPSEHLSSYVYNPGKWKAVVTYMPTEFKAQAYASQIQELMQDGYPAPVIPRPLDPTAYYTIDYRLYPGTVIELPEEFPEGTENLHVVLTWSGNVEMGMCLIDPNGAEVDHVSGGGGGLEINVPRAGSGRYSVAVFTHSSSASDVDFNIEYSYEHVKREVFTEELESAANGAVIAGLYNAPMLLTPSRGLDSNVESALNLLGVRKVYLVDFAGHSTAVKNDLEGMRSWLQPSLDVVAIKDIKSAVKVISKRSGSTGDVVFTTADPWSYWYVGSDGPEGEQPGSIAVGPAALSALHHGAPVILTENHEGTSAAQSWHNYFWVKAYPDRLPPSVGAMVLSARAVDDFLISIGLGKAGTSIITVAGQFDIGASWDRAYVGKYYPGRIFGTPLDEASWVSRSLFYTALIFANPAVSSEGVKLWTGSHSTRIGGVLTITEPEKEAVFKYPILQTWVSYQHRFNERGGEYWGCPYTDSVGITPFVTESPDEIDKGIAEPYKSGQVWPDMTESEVIPKYCEKTGFSSVFATNFDRYTEDMNRGVLLWLEVMHGGNRDDGIVGTWDPSANMESNPWRGYEENAMTLRGATDDPDVVTMSKMFGADAIPGFGPVTDAGIIPERHDGIIIAILQQEQTGTAGGLDFDKALKNIHSMGFNAGSCLIADTYLHLTLMRHGSVFQVIDPWLTSWYSAFAMELFFKDIALGERVGVAYANGIHHVGIEYLTEKWWWDIFENVVYYGDPDLMMWTPQHGWSKPVALKAGSVLGGHAPFGAKSHPHAIGNTFLLEMGIYATVIAAVAATAYLMKKRGIIKAGGTDKAGKDE